jgi:MATE family multidrug resistance protein
VQQSDRKALQQEVGELFRLGWPLIFTFICDVSFVTVTTIATSWISPTAVAAVGLTLNLLLLTIVFFFLCLSAIIVLTADLKGAGRQAEIGALLKSGFRLAALFSVIAAFFLYLLWLFLPALPLSPEGVMLAQEFLRIGAWVVPLDLFACVVMFASNGLGRTFWVGILNFASVPLLIFLTWVFAFSNLGIPVTAVEGCAYAIVLTIGLRSLAFLCLARQDDFKSINFWRGRVSPGVNDTRKILSVGIPLGLAEISALGSISVIGVLVAQIGVDALAAHNIANNVFVLTHVLIFGVSRATVIRIGLLTGRGAPAIETQRSIFASFILASLFSLVSMALLLWFASKITSIYTSESAVAALVTNLIFFIAFMKLIDDPAIVLQACLEAIQQTRTIFIVRFAGQWLIGLVVGYLASQWLGVYGFWLGIAVSVLFALIAFAHCTKVQFNVFSRQLD